jgi:hypothetical protein
VARYDLPATLAQLQALLDYYEQQGLVDPKTAGQLRKHLDQAAAKLAQGNVSAYRSQIRAFADQTADKTPQSVDPVASEQLIAEAELILAGCGVGGGPRHLPGPALRCGHGGAAAVDVPGVRHPSSR